MTKGMVAKGKNGNALSTTEKTYSNDFDAQSFIIVRGGLGEYPFMGVVKQTNPQNKINNTYPMWFARIHCD